MLFLTILFHQGSTDQAVELLVISTDLHGVITSINPAGEKLTGWSAAELVGRLQMMVETTTAPINRTPPMVGVPRLLP